jgi:hypothetical protein
MADLDDYVVAVVRKHIADRRTAIAEKFPKNLEPTEYAKHCGRHEELESLASVVQDAVRKANSAVEGDTDDGEDHTP